jgi:lipopolysaccharide transport system ATP-binding protein
VSDVVLEMSRVFKKFRKGEKHTSLRDLIPALTRRLVVSGTGNGKLQETEFWALSDISFAVGKGEALGIIGHNGAGKSTILKILTRIIEPTSGSMEVKGKLSALIEVGAGFHQDLTGRENIFLNGTILGMKKNEIKRKFDEIVEFSGLADFIDTPVKRYSSGMYARLGFSVAAHIDPDVLVVDEVLSVGDYAFQNKCMEKMNSILSGGSTVIFVSHNLRAVTELCRRCILLDHGKIVKEGPTDEVVRHYLDAGKVSSKVKNDKEVFISNVVVRGENGRNLPFKAGQKAFFEIEVTAKIESDKLSVYIGLVDDNHQMVFNTSTERLNHTTFCLKRGETRKVAFELDLHLAPGTYHFGAIIYRYDIENQYDACLPAATIYVSSDMGVRGVANLYPKAAIE